MPCVKLYSPRGGISDISFRADFTAMLFISFRYDDAQAQAVKV